LTDKFGNEHPPIAWRAVFCSPTRVNRETITEVVRQNS
jgi:hypothetical protein